MYAVIGSNGYLGAYIVRSLLSRADEQIICAARRSRPPFDDKRLIEWELDISDRNSADKFFDRFFSEQLKVIMLAAIHNPDAVASDFRKAWHTNITSLSYIINGIENLKGLYYASTDSVYGESINKHHFVETDKTNPVNPYGIQKSAAEQVVIHFGGHVARFPFLVGRSLLPDKPHFFDKIKESLLKSESVDMLSDSYRSSLDFGTAADLFVRLTQTDYKNPIVNICGDEDLSKYDVGLMIAENLGVSKKLIVPVTALDSNIYKTKRAASTLMDNSLLKNLLDIKRVNIDFKEGLL